jgi:large subunit ribosomal protein L30
MKVKLTLVKSPIGYSKGHRETLRVIGLKKIGSSVIREDNPAIQGVIRKCAHLLSVESIAE